MINSIQKRIVIADDDQDDYLIFSLAIKDLPFAVMLSHVSDGRQLMDLLEQEFPDILFLDILMPQKDGGSCLKEIRSNKKFDTLPIIMYSSVDRFQDVEFCYREGANLYLVKSGNFSELKTALQTIIGTDWKQAMYYPPLASFVVRSSST